MKSQKNYFFTKSIFVIFILVLTFSSKLFADNKSFVAELPYFGPFSINDKYKKIEGRFFCKKKVMMNKDID